jgi:phthiocerol/phenolphthiocerol synthesis type-I polyketide synthase E
LGLEQIGIHDDFFELGGDSLVAVQLIAKLRETLHKDFSAHTLLNAQTIASLAEVIGKSAKQTQKVLPTSLVEIQSGNSRHSPLFLIHPVGGHVYFYRDLASHLSLEQPVYGIQAQGMDGKTKLLQTKKSLLICFKSVQIFQST